MSGGGHFFPIFLEIGSKIFYIYQQKHLDVKHIYIFFFIRRETGIGIVTGEFRYRG